METDQAVDPAALLAAARRLHASGAALAAARAGAGGRVASLAPGCGALSAALTGLWPAVDAAVRRAQADHERLADALAVLAGHYRAVDRAAGPAGRATRGAGHGG